MIRNYYTKGNSDLIANIFYRISSNYRLQQSDCAKPSIEMRGLYDIAKSAFVQKRRLRNIEIVLSRFRTVQTKLKLHYIRIVKVSDFSAAGRS